jgi:predicted phage terminase large subunit-like protein
MYVMGVDRGINESPTSDDTAITTLGVDRETRECYVLEIWRDRIDFPSQVKMIQSKYEYMERRGTHVTKIGVESTAYQKALARSTFLVGLPVSEIRPSGSKIHRMLGLSPSIENGRNRFPDPAVRRESWFESFKIYYLAFPNGMHDRSILSPWSCLSSRLPLFHSILAWYLLEIGEIWS